MLRSSASVTADWLRLKNVVFCKLVGHDVDNGGAQDRCVCDEKVFLEDGTATQIRSNVSCFVFHHSYVGLGKRDGHEEYVCVYCGHTLLFESARDPFRHGGPRIDKKVNYLCNLLGHPVHQVCERDGFCEYACDKCGHPFLRAEAGLTWITHLPKTILGHAVRFVARRAGYSEFVCLATGHPFCFLVEGRELRAG